MPWKEESTMCQRVRLIEQLKLPGANVSQLCKAFKVSRKTAYKWLSRYESGGLEGLADRSRARQTQANQIASDLELLIVSTHKTYPYWGPRKLRNYLMNTGSKDLPAVTTFANVLRRNHCQVIRSNKSNPASQRFERSQPNELWQMDFKGSFMTGSYRCYPLTILDDYSRYSVGLKACRNEKASTVKGHLIGIFKEVGLPKQINVDNGNPWGAADLESYTSLQVWLMKLGIRVTHSSPYHPQTNGKGERFHRTLKLEVLHQRHYHDYEIQSVFDQWQHRYNYHRPHAALNGEPPYKRYCTSSRKFPTHLPIPEYTDAIVRKVHKTLGTVRFKGKCFRVGRGFAQEYVAIKETHERDIYSIFFMDNFIKKIKLGQGLR